MAGAKHGHSLREKEKVLDGPTLLTAFRSGTTWLGDNRSMVDSLNVFPVPDGDTGTNMYLTVNAALKEAEKAAERDTNGPVGVVADAIAMGSLMGARGNSGVIFSQLMRGFARKLHGLDTATAPDLAAAFHEAANVAYKAVMKPVEGTILTVARAGARAGVSAARDGLDVMGVLDEVIRQGEITLAKTPEMLPTLKEAGVVDAGGKGLIVFLQGFAQGLRGEPVSAGTTAVSYAPVQTRPSSAPAEKSRPVKHEIEFTYCTELIVKGQNLEADALKKSLSKSVKGDSMLVVGDENTIKVHMHTNYPGKILEACVAFGSLHEIHINNMEDQNEEFEGPGGNGEYSEPAAEAPEPSARAKDLGIVAVAAGDGIEMILRSLGADIVVAGGQTMNPSIQDIVAAVQAVPAREVIVLPNNGNVVLTARQAAEITGLTESTKVHVVPSKTVPQGVSALLAMSPSSSPEENVQRMSEAISKVKTGEITYAVRDSKFNGFEIHQNDIIGILDGEIKSVGTGVDEVFQDLFDKMHSDDDEIATVLYGAGVSEADAEALMDSMREKYPNMEFEVQYGGQPLYYYLISVE